MARLRCSHGGSELAGNRERTIQFSANTSYLLKVGAKKSFQQVQAGLDLAAQGSGQGHTRGQGQGARGGYESRP